MRIYVQVNTHLDSSHLTGTTLRSLQVLESDHKDSKIEKEWTRRGGSVSNIPCLQVYTRVNNQIMG